MNEVMSLFVSIYPDVSFLRLSENIENSFENADPDWNTYYSLDLQSIAFLQSYYTPRNEVRGGILDSACLSVRLSVCPLTFSCPPCSIYSSGWILSIFGTNDQ